MPVTRSRRRSSLPHLLSPPSKTLPGTYSASAIAVPSLPHRLTFCPNVTPVTYSSSTPDDLDDTTDAGLFPPSEEPSQTTSKRRQPPGKRRSQGYIPRPPNAFMLFRADFVKQKHVPGSIETNHSSLSRIIGNCWRSLPAQDKRIWEIKAKHAKEKHKQEFPDYKFKPVHKKKNKAGAAVPASSADSSLKSTPTPVPAAEKPVIQISTEPRKSAKRLAREEAAKQARDEFLTQLLLLGHRGDTLQEQMAEYDEQVRLQRDFEAPSSDSETEWDDSHSVSASDATTLLGADDSFSSNGKLHLPPSSTSTSSPAPTWSNPFANNAPIDWQQPAASTSSWGMMRRPSSVPPMGSNGMGMDVDMSSAFYTWQQPQQDFTATQGEFRPPSPSPSQFPPVGISSYAQQQGQIYAPQPTQKLPSFSQYLPPQTQDDFNPRLSFGFSQWNMGFPASAGSFNPRGSISHEHRMLLGGRRASSAQGMRRSWGTASQAQSWGWPGMWQPQQTQESGELQRDDEPLPEVDTSLFNPGFGFGGAEEPQLHTQEVEVAGAGSPGAVEVAVSPLDPVPVYQEAGMPPSAFSTHAPTPEYTHAQEEYVYHAQESTIDLSRPSFVMAYPPSVPIDSEEYARYTAGVQC
ncbi:hypothetical protein VNI00_009378 [Paramarasmius palmivorus]|uniref:HMG box domain-containing protein n=1 Tax=Paramarasmius palmivorus TaxID=297713 RepID=A0AAW0CNQ3_9AGAR